MNQNKAPIIIGIEVPEIPLSPQIKTEYAVALCYITEAIRQLKLKIPIEFRVSPYNYDELLAQKEVML